MNELKKRRYTLYELNHTQEGITQYEIDITRDLYEDIERDIIRYNDATHQDEYMQSKYITTLHLDDEELRAFRVMLYAMNNNKSYDEVIKGVE